MKEYHKIETLPIILDKVITHRLYKACELKKVEELK